MKSFLWVLSLCLILVPRAGHAEPSVAEKHGVEVVEEQSGDFRAKDLWFQSRIHINASCDKVFDVFTLPQKFQALVPHVNGKVKVKEFTKPGDTVWYEFDRADGTKNSGRFVATEIVEDYKGQMVVLPDDGPWLRIQEMRLYAPAGQDKDAEECHALYEETYNPRPLENAAYDMRSIVQDIREPYMEIVLRRMKNIAEGKTPGPEGEDQKLREISRHFP